VESTVRRRRREIRKPSEGSTGPASPRIGNHDGLQPGELAGVSGWQRPSRCEEAVEKRSFFEDELAQVEDGRGNSLLISSQRPSTCSTASVPMDMREPARKRGGGERGRILEILGRLRPLSPRSRRLP